MPDFSKNSKAEIMSFLSGMPGGIAFAGWEGSGAKYDAPTARQSWMSAMKNPEYDEEIEKAMLTSMSHLTGGGPMAGKDQMMPPKLKFLQEAKETPQEGPFPIGLRVFNAITRK
jgi:hypothetical protein